MNTKLRQEATNNFESDLYKWMNNSFYGKQIENVRNRCDIKVLISPESFFKRSDHKTRKILDKKTILLARKNKK